MINVTKQPGNLDIETPETGEQQGPISYKWVYCQFNSTELSRICLLPGILSDIFARVGGPDIDRSIGQGFFFSLELGQTCHWWNTDWKFECIVWTHSHKISQRLGTLANFNCNINGALLLSGGNPILPNPIILGHWNTDTSKWSFHDGSPKVKRNVGKMSTGWWFQF